MYDTKHLQLNTAVVLTAAIIGTILMMGLDLRDIGWLKFILYVLFFATISSPAGFSSQTSCSSMLRRLRK